MGLEGGLSEEDILEKQQNNHKYIVREQFNRWCIYIVGMCMLAAGITLNTRTGLGVSPIISISFCAAEIQLLPLNFGDMTFLLYALFVAIQLPLRKGRERVAVLLQLVISLAFSRLLNVYGALFTYQHASHGLSMNLAVLVIAIMLTGIGVAMTINMRLFPNPADGLVGAIAEKTGLAQGLTKNIFDITCVVLSCVIGFAATRQFVGIGIGTVIAMLGVGRVIAVVNRLAGAKMLSAAFPNLYK